MFNGAKNLVVTGGSFVANADGPSKSHLDKLVDQVAPNAILNAGGRVDEVRCFPGTREEVIARLEQFMDDKSPGRKRMMWLSGPAGAGKSAICQTVAERRSEQGRQAANFFFFRGDRTRSHSKPLVATLVYQLLPFYPALYELLSDYLTTDPLIGSTSIEKQFKQLLSSSFQTIRHSTPIQQPIFMIIDGLDECSNDEREQDQILVALHTLAHADHSPFLILVSSRAEPQLVMSFNRLGSSVASIFLNEDYQPQKDIRRFVVEKFAEIKKNHHLARTLSADWPTNTDIEAIVDKSSNHFIYAATVMRYIEFSSSNPALSLLTILEMRPFTGDHNPLSHLDAIYSYIFSKVYNIGTVKLILFARSCINFNIFASPANFGLTMQLVGYKSMEIESFFAPLVSIIQVLPDSSTGGIELVFYHASLDDYLKDKSRSTIYYVHGDEIAAELSSMCLRNIQNDGSIQLTLNPLLRVQNPTPELSESLLDASTKSLAGEKWDLADRVTTLISLIERLYWKYDKAQFKALLQGWSRFVSINVIENEIHGMVRARDPSAFQYYKLYWMTEKYGQQKMLMPPDFVPVGNARRSTRITSTRASPNAVIDSPIRNLIVRKPRAFPQNIPATLSKGRGGNPAPAAKAEGNTPITPARASLNIAGGSPTRNWSVYKPGTSPQNMSITPHKGRGGSPVPTGVSRSSSSIPPAEASLNAAIGSSTRGLSVQKPEVSSQITRAAPPKGKGGSSLINQPGSTGHVINTHKEGEGHESGEYDDGHYEPNMIRVKLHYQDDMLSASDTPFSEFVDKVAAKLGKNFDELVMEFKDKDGDKITLRDDSDYEHAIQTARDTRKGKAEGALEIWCQDSAQ